MFVHRCSFLSLLNVARFADYGISSILCKAKRDSHDWGEAKGAKPR